MPIKVIDKKSNTTTFEPQGQLKSMFLRAQKCNKINEQLSKLLPAGLADLSLCFVDGNIATLTSANQVVAFRAQTQNKLIISILNKITGLESINKISVKIAI